MRNFVYRCPVTRMNVQGTAVKEDDTNPSYVTQSCPACGGVHLIDPATGEGPKGSKSPKGRVAPSYKLESRK